VSGQLIALAALPPGKAGEMDEWTLEKFWIGRQKEKSLSLLG
jgi:hypothetical protein